MDSTERIILSGSLNKSSKNENMSLNTVLSGNKKLLPEDSIEDVVDLYEQYVKERKESNKFRLIVNINPFCSNVLFNPFTEIVRRNGNSTTFLNYEDGLTNITGTIGKGDSYTWTAYDAIRDTQLSNDACGFDYYCGIDIFNNHILRNKTFKSVNYSSISELELKDYSEVYSNAGYSNRPIQQDSQTPHMYVVRTDFNTIDDYMRDRSGIIVQDIKLSANINELSDEIRMPLHLYQNYDAYTFEDCIKNKLIERNGWFGFSNPSTMNTVYTTDGEEDKDASSTSFSVTPNSIAIDCEEEGTVNRKLVINLSSASDNIKNDKNLNFNKTINNKAYCDFIDMYPTRELYSFSPLYNGRQRRYEKNWNYCLTYPSKSIIKDFNDMKFPFFEYRENEGTTALKAVTFDEYTVDDDGRNLVTIYSICKHGLKEGDKVNIYRNYSNEEELPVYSNGTVVRIVDKYIFQIYKESYDISRRWINVDEIEWDNSGNAEISILNDDGTTDTVTCNYNGEVVMVDGAVYKVSESKRCNIDPEIQNICFKRVLSDVECEYYVRVFSRLPNFKFADAEINDYNLYENKELDLINRYSDPSDAKCEFESHISDMSFAKTSYGDNDTEIVFTDDIDVSYLKDNLGRPLSEIYLTILKNNKGYKEWYTGHVNDENIEYSHCFGYNSSSFLFNEYYRNSQIGINDVRDVRDIYAGNKSGLFYKENSDDEIVFDEVRDFYGDICYYCPVECDEYSLGAVMGRFNTVQRELAYYEDLSIYGQNFNSLKDADKNGVMFHDEIINDESGVINNDDGKLNDLYESFKNGDLNHSSFHLPSGDEKDSYKYKNMLTFSEGYYYKMHYKIPLKTVSMSISKDDGITYELFEKPEKNGNNLKIKTVYENNLSLNDKLTLYDKIDNKFYYLTVSEIYTKFYFECSVKNEDLTEGFKGNTKDLENYNLIKRKQGTPEYAKLIKDGSSTYYWRNIIPNGIERNDSKIYPFTNGAFYVNKQINFFLRRQDPEKNGLVSSFAEFDYVPDGEFLPIDYFDNLYYDSEEIETC